MTRERVVDRVRPFERLTDRYEAWFTQHEPAFESEVAALKPLVETPGPALEVGVGSGRFAAALGVDHGVEPSRAMAALARQRGVETVRGVGEALPFAPESFERVLVVVTLCYLDDPVSAVDEARRVLGPGGCLVIGFIDGDSHLGRGYREAGDTNPFYAPARFYTLDEVETLLGEARFEIETVRQTLVSDPSTMDRPDPVLDGAGEGTFLTVSARMV